MYSIGEKIVYGMRGVFEISDIREEVVLGASHKYYVMHALEERSQSLLFVPVDNEALVSMMRYPISKKDAESLIKEIPRIEAAPWQRDSRARGEVYKKLIESGDHRNLISVIKSVWHNTEMRKADGKKGYISDENTQKRAEAILYSELALALGIKENEVAEYIIKKIEKC